MKSVSETRGVTLDTQKLRDLRSRGGMSQVHLAKVVGVSDDTIGRAERGQSISFDNARAIATYFKVDVGSLAAAPAPVDPPIPAPSREASAVAMSNIPIRVPTHFLGRDDALAEIADALARYEGRVAITALHGLRGVGKTVLAAAFADRHATDYRATWWIRAETESGMRADLVGLGVRLGWVDPEEKEEPALATVMERLAHDGDGILLIYDNAVAADAIRPYLPRGGAARVLVTSNAHNWRGIAAPIEIDLWPKEIGAEFLVRRTGRTAERAAAEALSEALGGLPLAHEQAAAYCERLEIPLAEYARRFAAEPAKMLDAAKDAPAEYHDKLTVAKTFALAIEAAMKPPLGHPAAALLITLCAHLAPEPIPLFLFAETLGKPGGPLEGDSLDEAIAALRAFALVDREAIRDERDPEITTDTIRLHRLVREVAASQLAAKHALRLRGALIASMASVYPRGIHRDPSTWPRARRLDDLALALVGGNAPLPEGAEAPASLLLDRAASYRQHVLGAYRPARPLLERALAIDEKTLGSEHQQTLTSVNNLAACLETLGEAAAALPLYQRALEGRERILGPEHPDTLSSVNNLAYCLHALDEAEAALPLFRRTLESRERLLGPKHPDTLGSVNNLAGCLETLGKAEAALPLYQRALESKKLVLGPEHPDTLRSVNNLAHCLLGLGDADAALPLFRLALESRERMLGPEHPDTLISVNNLAGCLLGLGEAGAALPLFRRALAGFKKMLGPDHPTTIIAHGNLSFLEAEAGRP